MVVIVFGFFLGVLSLCLLPSLPSLMWILVYSLVFLCILLILIVCELTFKLFTSKFLNKKFKVVTCNTLKIFLQNNFKSFLRLIFIALKLSIFFCLGLSYAVFRAEENITRAFPVDLQKKNLRVLGKILSVPEKEECSFLNQSNNHCVRYEVEVLKTYPEYLWKNPGRVRLRSQHTVVPRVGEILEMTVKLKRIRGYSNPGSFDKERHYFLNRWVAEGYVIQSEVIRQHSNQDSNLATAKIWIDSIREKMKEHINIVLKNKKFSALIIALTTGLREGVTEKHWRILRETGTTHLMTISGLEMAVIFAAMWRMGPATFLTIPVPVVGASCSLVLAIIYAFLSGFSIATQRTLVMAIVFMLGMIKRRLVLSWNSYFLSLGIVLLIDPLSVLSPGFWLSFVAAGMMLYGIKSRLQPHGWWWKWGRAQWVVLLGLIPITLAAFQEFSWIAPIVNLVAVPSLSLLIVPLAFMGGLVSFLNLKLASFFLIPAEFGLNLLWGFFEYMLSCSQKLGSVTVQWANFSEFSILLAGVGVLVLLAARGWPKKYLGLFWMLPMFFGGSKQIGTGECVATVLDVGQGLSVVIETKTHVLLYDTGPKLLDNFDTGARVVLPFLKNMGKLKIDTIVISHADKDHVGGLVSILKEVKGHPPLILTPEPEITRVRNYLQARENIKISSCYQGQAWEYDGVKFEFLHPERYQKINKRNDYSCVLKVSTAQDSFLLTGDIEANIEQELIKKHGEKLHSRVLLVPHHGSKSSSMVEFIKMVDPHYALVPAGYLNQFHHPRPEVINRYQALGISSFTTIQEGAISFKLGDNSHGKGQGGSNLENTIIFHHYRRDQKRFWQTPMPEDFK